MTTQGHAERTPEVLAKLRARVAEAARRVQASQLRASTHPEQRPRHAGPFALTEVQQAYLVGRLEDVDLGGIGCHSYTEFDAGIFDEQSFENGLRSLVRRHGMLRAVVVGGSQQEILEEVPPITLIREDLSGMRPDAVQERLGAIRSEMSHRRFDLTRWPWFEFRVTWLPDGKARLHASIDVMMVDGSSVRLMFAELGTLYRGNAIEAPAPALSFADYLSMRDAARRPDRLRQSALYWQEWLRDMPAPPELPLAHAPQHFPRFSRRALRLEATDWSRIQDCARRLAVPAVSLLIATYAQALFRWSASERFCLNLTMYDRQPVHPDVHRLIGNFTTVVLLAVAPGNWSDAHGAARQVHRTLWEAMDHADVSGIEVLRRAAQGAADGASFAPRAPVVFTSMVGTGGPDAHPMHGLREIYGVSQTPQVLLDCQAYEDGQALCIAWDARDDLFLPGVLDGIFSTFEALLRQTWPDADTGDWTPTAPIPTAFAADDAVSGTLHAGFMAMARSHPGARAVQHNGQVISYGELLRRAGAVASHLQGHDSPVVGIMLPKGIEQVVAVLGTVMAGRAYLPLSTDLPVLRIGQMLELGAARLVLTDEAGKERLGHAAQAPLVPMSDLATSADGTWTPPQVNPHDQAYVIFTSGSTGTPKGVKIRHAAAFNTIDAVNRQLKLGPHDAVLGVSSLGFDLSVFDIFGTLAAGACLVLPDESQGHDPANWSELAHSAGVTIWNSVPALFELFVEQLEKSGTARTGLKLRWALLSGDWIPVNLGDRARAVLAQLEVMSLGGATEVSIWSVWYHIGLIPAESPSVPYGRAMPGQRLLVLDAKGQVCPVWVAGDLFIDGAGLADGYAGLPQETAAAFAVHPATQQRMYRTGDRARLMPSGELEFLGRRDRQTKLRGYRVELGEIEHVLLAHPEVRSCAMTIAGSVAGRAQLLGYVVPSGEQVSAQVLLQHLASRLPHYMVPDRVILLEKLPLTPNGKLDVGALPHAEPVESRAAQAPAGGFDAHVATVVGSVFDAVLKQSSCGFETHLLHAGGTSLDAVRIVVRVRELFGITLSLRSFLAEPTVRNLTSLVCAAKASGPPHPRREVLRLEQRRFPLSPAQHGLWTLYLADPQDLAYNTVDGFLLHGSLDVQLFGQAVSDVVARHEALRTTFANDADGSAYQQVHATGPSLTIVEVPQEGSVQSIADAIARQEARRQFLPQQEPPARFTLVHGHAGQSAVVVAMHHIICDGWSLNVLLQDLLQAYDARFNERPRAEVPRLQPGDFIVWRQAGSDPQAVAALRDGWRQLLQSAPLRLTLPGPRVPLPLDTAGKRRYFTLGKETTSILRDVAKVASTSLYVVLLQRFAAAVGELTGAADLVIGTPVADRFHPLTEALVGMFINTVPVRLTLPAMATGPEAVEAARRQVLAAMEMRELPFHEIVQAVNPPRIPGTHPLFSVMFALQEASAPAIPNGTLRAEPLAFELASAKFELTLECRLVGDGLACFLEYRPQAVADSFVIGLQDRFVRNCMAPSSHASFQTWAANDVQAGARITSGTGTSHLVVPVHAAGLAGFVQSQAQRSPDALALDAPQGQLSYAQLVEQASAVAAAIRSLCVGETLIAVRGGCTRDTVVCVLAVLLAGAAFTMVDASAPVQRVAGLMARCGSATLIETGTPAAWPDGIRCIKFSSIATGPSPKSTLAVAEGQSLAYVAFTSGSTGTPNAVAIQHDAICARIAWAVQEQTVLPGDRVLMMTPIGFDVAVCEIFETLATGGTLVTSPHTDLRDAAALASCIANLQISVINLTPSLLAEIMQVPHLKPPPLRRINCGAEALSQATADAALATFAGAKLFNFYGLTECSVDSTVAECLPGTAVNVGNAIAGAQVLILDDDLAPAAPGMPGEIWITGPGLAREYLGEPALTAARFLPRPGGGRMYRSGDMGRWTPGGGLALLGRRDEQVKIRGVRIELAEVAQAIRLHPAVADCMLIVEEAPSGPSLCAIVVAPDVTPGEIRSHLQQRLPTAFIPSQIVSAARLPRGANGKLDREAARELVAMRTQVGRQNPRNLVEQAVAQAFSQLLGAPEVGRDADFFDLGGHSLMAGRLAALLQTQFGARVTIADIVEHPTVQALATLLHLGSPRIDHGAVILRDGTGPAVFLVHPLGGEVTCYIPLARNVRPGPKLLGLPVPRDVTGIQSLAQHHASTISTRQPVGPLVLAGWSAGGLIAVAVAAELERLGREVSRVVLIDSAPYRHKGDSSDDDFLRLVLAELAPDHEPTAFAAMNTTAMLAWIKEHELLPWQTAEAEMLDRIKRSRALDQALGAHSFAPVKCALILAQSGEAQPGTDRLWAALSSAGVKVFAFDATHYSILRDPRMADIFEHFGGLS